MYHFQRTPWFARVSTAIAATLLGIGCRDVVSPTPRSPIQPVFAVSGASAGIRGTGSIGTGPAAPGSPRQDFDFDITSDLAGHLTLTDWSIVRSPTTVGSLTVSVDDQATWFAAFRDGSAACADPTHGVEVDGTGRLDNGLLLQFTLYACDNGSAGSTDFIRFYAPGGGPYDRNGNLSSGDLVKTATATRTSADTRISGVGALGSGTATPGNNRQDFDFDVNASSGGRLKFTDYSNVMPDGNAEYLIVDPANDPATGVTSFQQTSDRCVRFGGNSRVDGGSIYPFYADACDNASNGTGFDTFIVTLPDVDGVGKTYRSGGTITVGDVALSGGSTPTTGTLDVTTTTTGSNLDPDGYTVTVDGTNSQPIAVNGSQTFSNLSSGSHTVALSGVAANCTVSGGNSQTANVPAGGSVSVAFQVSCATTATTGTLNITATTTGSSLDPDGYTVTVDGTNAKSIASNGTQSFADLSSGSHSVALSGVAANCTVSGGTSRTVDVPAGGSTSAAFEVSCAAPAATQLAFTVQPSNATAGSPISPAVQVTARDAAGNVATSFSGTITIALGANPSGGTLSGSTTVSAVNGVATFSDLRIIKAGTGYGLTAAASGLTRATSASFSVSAASASVLVFTVQPSTTQAGSSISPAVKVTARDAYGNTATSFNGSMTMSIGRNPSGGTLSGTTTITAASGVGTFSNLKIDRAGNGYTLQVGGSGVAGAESAQFNVTQPPLICLLGVCIG